VAAAEGIRVGGTDLKVRRTGKGPPVVFLHGEDGLLFTEPFLERLGRTFEVIAPSHPAWGSPRPSYVRTVDDISYIYLDLLEQLDGPCVVVGASMGGWLAAEIATKNETRIAALVLVAPIGVKTGGRDDRAFVDIYASGADEVRAALYGDPVHAPDMSRLSDEDFLALATAQEAVTRFGWEPYMHNPQLRHRLARIHVPTLVVAGGNERFVLEPDYYAAFASAIGPNAELAVIAGAGHRVEEEAPEELCDVVVRFVDRRGRPVAASESDRTPDRTRSG
jgi:pimeloyl-ACP methyl ester carboxylesterase